MDEVVVLENQIQEEVDALREQFSNTRDLYREVCALLFFRYGITPTTNKLYRFVRKGSMSVPTEALSNFWKELREKSKIRIEQPDLPEDLANMAGEVMTKIWTKAQLYAHESLVILRNETEVRVTKLLVEIDSISIERDDAALKLSSKEEEIHKQSLKLKELEQLQVASERQNCYLKQQLDNNIKKVEGLHRSIKESDANNRNRLSILIQDVKQEKSRATRLESELNTARTAYANLEEKNKVESNVLKSQFSDLRERTGELKGKLQLTESNNSQLNVLLEVKEEKIKEIMAKLANSEPVIENWSKRIHNKKIKRLIALKRE